MAQANRETNDLRTLKLRMVPGRSETVVHCDFYRGRDHMTDMRWPADAFAIPTSLSIEAVREREYVLFDPAAIAADGGLNDIAAFLESAGWLDSDEPIWLQVAQGSNYLATVPWEGLIRHLTGSADLTIFRIPNFVAPPRFASAAPRIAICASSPRAKAPFELPYHVTDAVAALSGAVGEAEIHVFVDQSAHEEVSALASDGTVRVVVHDPHEAEDLGTGGRRLTDLPGETSSPWLLWMEEQLGNHRTDLVHFISPGYFTADLGGLALAHSPLADIDARRAHFVSASETNHFLNSVGAWAAGFTIPRPDPWSVGVRVFAEQLARQRSEPIVVHEPQPAGYAGLEAMYAAMLGQPGAPPPAAAGISAHVHPRRFVPEEEFEVAVVSAEKDYAGGFEEIAGAQWRDLLTKAAYLRGESQPQERWKASLQLEVEQTLSKLAVDRIVTPEQRGEAAALNFIQQALDDSTDFGVDL